MAFDDGSDYGGDWMNAAAVIGDLIGAAVGSGGYSPEYAGGLIGAEGGWGGYSPEYVTPYYYSQQQPIYQTPPYYDQQQPTYPAPEYAPQQPRANSYPQPEPATRPLPNKVPQPLASTLLVKANSLPSPRAGDRSAPSNDNTANVPYASAVVRDGVLASLELMAKGSSETSPFAPLQAGGDPLADTDGKLRHLIRRIRSFHIPPRGFWSVPREPIIILVVRPPPAPTPA